MYRNLSTGPPADNFYLTGAELYTGTRASFSSDFCMRRVHCLIRHYFLHTVGWGGGEELSSRALTDLCKGERCGVGGWVGGSTAIERRLTEA